MAAVKSHPLTEFTGRGSGRRADGRGRSAGLDPSEHGLPAVPAVGPGAGGFRGFLPVVIEGDQLPLQERRAGCEGSVYRGLAFPRHTPFCRVQKLCRRPGPRTVCSWSREGPAASAQRARPLGSKNIHSFNSYLLGAYCVSTRGTLINSGQKGKSSPSGWVGGWVGVCARARMHKGCVPHSIPPKSHECDKEMPGQIDDSRNNRGSGELGPGRRSGRTETQTQDSCSVASTAS